MGIANYNQKSNRIEWNKSTDGMEFVKCSELEIGKVYNLYGYFITADNGYGEGAVLITDDCLVSISQRFVDIIKAMMEDTAIIEDVKAGKCGFKITTFKSKKYKTDGYNVEFVEL